MPSLTFLHAGDANNGTPEIVAAVTAPAVRTLQELAAVDPADMTTAELLATWKGETDPESAPADVPANDTANAGIYALRGYFRDASGQWRRPFNYSTRGASDGPTRKYRAGAVGLKLHGETLSLTARDFTPAYLRQLFAPTKADSARLALRPIALAGPRRLTAAQIERDRGFYTKKGQALANYTAATEMHRSRVITAAGALALEITANWAYEIGTPAASALEGSANV